MLPMIRNGGNGLVHSGFWRAAAGCWAVTDTASARNNSDVRNMVPPDVGSDFNADLGASGHHLRHTALTFLLVASEKSRFVSRRAGNIPPEDDYGFEIGASHWSDDGGPCPVRLSIGRAAQYGAGVTTDWLSRAQANQ